MESIYAVMLALALCGLPLQHEPASVVYMQEVAAFQPLMLPAAPRGLTQAERAGLRGPVRAVRLDFDRPPGSSMPPQRSLSLQFDPHGSLTEMVCLPLLTSQGTLPQEACTVVPQYDAKHRLQRATLTDWQRGTPQGEERLQADIRHILDEHGRLATLRVTLDLDTFSTVCTYDAQGRLCGQRDVWEDAKKQVELLTAVYRYERDGVVVETVHTPVKLKERQWYDTRGLLVKWQDLDARGTVKAQIDLRYNAHGDVLGLTRTAKGRQERFVYGDYVYDAHGNWTARTLSVIEKQQRKDVTTPLVKQTRTLSYHA